MAQSIERINHRSNKLLKGNALSKSLNVELFSFDAEKSEEIVENKPNIASDYISKSDDIKKLSPYSFVRLRTTVYYGSTSLQSRPILSFNDDNLVLNEISWVPAVYTCYREIIDNALDEVVAHGYGNRIDINYDEKTLLFSVEDNGRGIPIDFDPEYKMHKATLALTHLMTGRNFESRGDTAGMNGVGAAGVSFCSEFFQVEIHRDQKKFTQSFKENNEAFAEELQISKPVIVKKEGPTGTKITLKLSKKVFSNITLPESFMRSRIMEIAISNPKLKVVYNGTQIKSKTKIETSLFGSKYNIPIEISDEALKFKSRFWLVPRFVESGDHFHSSVNNINTLDGGIHIDSFKKLFFSGLMNALERENKKRKLIPNRSDINEGLLIYNITNMVKPDFDSQTKSRLINEEVSNIFKTFFENEEFYKDIIKKNKEWIEEIYARCAERTQKKDAGDVAKLARKVLRNKVPGLMDATGNKRQQCVLFLAEGESAVSGLSSVRNPEIHGGLGLRGKVLNVNGENPKKILDNKCLVEIMNSIGLIIGQKANRSFLRYGKVYLATDSDQDGSNIAALLVNFFYSYWPELFNKLEEPFIHIFQTPFVIAEKGKQRKYWYAHNYSEFKPNDWSGWSITRAKGLGTLTEEDWAFSLQSPVAIPIIDDGKILEALDLVFNSSRSDDRKKWIGL
jgi:DNA gyrase/topoisomerase IV subunit B